MKNKKNPARPEQKKEQPGNEPKDLRAENKK